MQTQNTITRQKSPLRYRIKAILTDMMLSDTNRIKARVIQKTNVSRSSLSRYLNERKGGESHMPVIVLEAFAEELGEPMQNLLNPETEEPETYPYYIEADNRYPRNDPRWKKVAINGPGNL